MALRKDGTRRGTPSPHDPVRTAPGSPQPCPGHGDRIIPNKNRTLQIAPTRRKLFGRKAKDAFLEWFAATCNISLAARKCGFHYRTVLRHWREDIVFGAQCEEALKLGYVRLEALALGEDGVGYGLADASASGLSPEGWARSVAGVAQAWSPDRADALVWALTELMLGRQRLAPAVRSLG